MTNLPSLVGQTEPVEFTVLYEGGALADHTMPVRDLGPAMVVLGEAFDRANALLNGTRSWVELEVQATQGGSFELVLLLQQMFTGAVPMLSGDFVSAAANLKDLFFTNGLFTLVKRLKGSQPVVVGQEGGNLIIEAERLRMVIPPEVLRLYADPFIRRQIEGVVRPLHREGVDRVVFRDRQRSPLESVEKDEAASFTMGDELQSHVASTESLIPRQRLKPAAVTFERDGKWRLNDGERTRWYTISDSEFSNDVANDRIRFGSGDTLICDVVARQTLNLKGQLRMDYEVVRVVEHIVNTGGSDPASSRLIG